MAIINVTDDALKLLNGMTYDPRSKASYEVMSGGLFWPDEFPKLGAPGSRVVWEGFLPRFLIAYRASLTIEEPRDEFRSIWEQVVNGAPNWPGLHEERRGPKARSRLLAAKRREKVCLAEAHEWKF